MLTFASTLQLITDGNEEAARDDLIFASSLYYGEGESPFTDAEFDDLQAKFEAKFNKRFKTAQPLAFNRHATMEQNYPLLANWLNKANNEDELSKWLEDRAKEVSEVLVSSKWDGMSIVVTYNSDGIPIHAVTRGEDGLGVDCLRLFAGEYHWRILPETLANWCLQNTNLPKLACDQFCKATNFGVKYEVVMRWSDLQAMNHELGSDYRNPRNTVAGIISAEVAEVRREYISLAPLDIEWHGIAMSRMDRLLLLDMLIENGLFIANSDKYTGGNGLPTPWSFTIVPINEVVDFYRATIQQRATETNEYMIDGLVIELVDDSIIEKLGGRVSDCPNYVIAAKFPPAIAYTKAISLDWDLGNSGRRTPVVNFEPVILNGNTFDRTSIANLRRFDQLALGNGSPLILELRGDIIGWLNRSGPDPDGVVPFDGPDANWRITYNKSGERVFAYEEAPLAGRCERMLVKCGVRDIRIETLTKLVECNLITRLVDVWKLVDREDDIANLEGFGKLSATIIVSTLRAKLAAGLKDWEILASLGINGIGRSISKQALKHVTLESLLLIKDEASYNEIKNKLKPVIGPERPTIILDGVLLYLDDLEDLMNLGFTQQTDAPNSVERALVIVVTGDLKRWSRDEFKDLVEAMGHKISNSITKKTDYLVTNTPLSGTKKNKQATAAGIPIVDENNIMQILGISKIPDTTKQLHVLTDL